MIEEELWDILEWVEEDEGIGWYDYGEGTYRDVNIQANLSSYEVELECPNMDEDDYIPVAFGYSGEVWFDEKSYEAGIYATLNKAEWRDSKFFVTYDVEQT
tara:strand:- start:778 stop:1080 length:303 start_codon:yes stop_codon:yes gene_type:complete